MNYRKTYIKIIKKALLEKREKYKGVYYENHHILPKSLFPLWKKRKSNQVLLTAREHFFCHQLLVKIYNGYMINALFRLMHDKQNNQILTSKDYEKIRKQFADSVSKQSKKMVRNENWKTKISNSLKGKKHSIERIENIKNARALKGYNVSEETRKKISKTMKKIKSRSVICITTGKIYESIGDAISDTGATHVSDVCNGYRKKSKNLEWRWYNG